MDRKIRNVGGRPQVVDWAAIAAALEQEVANRGFPELHNVNGWKSQADVVRWVATFLRKRGEKSSETAIRDHVRAMLKAITSGAGRAI